MGSLRKRGGYWYVDITYQGERHIVSTKTGNKATARKILTEIEHQASLGTFNLEQYEKKQIKLAEFAQKYNEYVTGTRAASTNVVERMYIGLFVKKLGDINLRRIQPEMLDVWASGAMEKYEASPYNTMRKILHTMFNIAVKWGY